jgi:hypothetical protein
VLVLLSDFEKMMLYHIDRSARQAVSLQQLAYGQVGWAHTAGNLHMHDGWLFAADTAACAGSWQAHEPWRALSIVLLISAC